MPQIFYEMYLLFPEMSVFLLLPYRYPMSPQGLYGNSHLYGQIKLISKQDLAKVVQNILFFFLIVLVHFYRTQFVFTVDQFQQISQLICQVVPSTRGHQKPKHWLSAGSLFKVLYTTAISLSSIYVCLFACMYTFVSKLGCTCIQI